MRRAKGLCRICGCSEDNCSQCIQRTGRPCSWVAENLCSACKETAAVIDAAADVATLFEALGCQGPAEAELVDAVTTYKQAVTR